ncbi:MAG: hypothetical protein H7196_01990 [candidate division SR1 bacterium]|nr:hypothetical protein [candidate division SR1 bacterium]
MWPKNFRKCVIASVYQNLFWDSFNGSEYIPDWTVLINEIKNEDIEFTESDLIKVYNIYLSNKEIYIDQIIKHINKWDKTFDIIKACLIVFLLESNLNEDKEAKLVGHYIKFAQDFAGGENPALVHAVISKMIEESA